MTAKKRHLSCVETVGPVREALDVINGKWKLPIIISITYGNERFTEIQESIPKISPKVLAKELKELEKHQLIKRVVIDDYPVRILYKPQPYAETLTPLIETLRAWGLNHRKRMTAK